MPRVWAHGAQQRKSSSHCVPGGSTCTRRPAARRAATDSNETTSALRRPLAPAPAHVAKADNVGWSLSGAQRSQPMATGGKWARAESGSEKRKPLPCVATGCLKSSMVRRGSTVRVRQRASSFRLLSRCFCRLGSCRASCRLVRSAASSPGASVGSADAHSSTHGSRGRRRRRRRGR